MTAGGKQLYPRMFSVISWILSSRRRPLVGRNCQVMSKLGNCLCLNDNGVLSKLLLIWSRNILRVFSVLYRPHLWEVFYLWVLLWTSYDYFIRTTNTATNMSTAFLLEACYRIFLKLTLIMLTDIPKKSSSKIPRHLQ